MKSSVQVLFVLLVSQFFTWGCSQGNQGAQPVSEKTGSDRAATADQENRFYVVSNKQAANSVVGWRQSDSGEFELFGEFMTGGQGTGPYEVPDLKRDLNHPLANGDDPLISANALMASDDGRYAAVVNPGDGTVSLMGIAADGTMAPLSIAKASDRFPLSLDVHGDMVAVASLGTDNGKGSIALYRIFDDSLLPVAGSRRDLMARPSTIGFSADGEHVIVNELVTGKIKVYAVAGGTLSGEPTAEVDSPREADDRFQAIPVGWVLRDDGEQEIILMSEARFLTPDFKLREGNGEVVQAPAFSWQTGSVSSYALSDDGRRLQLISADVLTGDEVEGGELANCWVALSADGNTLFAVNALSSSLSSFSVGESGALQLKELLAFKDDSEERFLSDITLNHDGTLLYQLVGNQGQVIIFDVSGDGRLKMRQVVSGLPEYGSYGLLSN